MTNPTEKLIKWNETRKVISENATPGPWHYVHGDVIREENRDDGLFALHIATEGGDGEWKYDGRFIADSRNNSEKYAEIVSTMTEALRIISSHPNAEPLAAQWASVALSRCVEIVGGE